MDKFGIDSHKLMYHIERVYDWSRGKEIYPIYMELSPTNSCNHRCIFCAFDYLKYEPIFSDKKIFKRFLNEIVKNGVKSIMFGGEGEPLLHKDIGEFISYAKSKGIDVAITTNGVFLEKGLISSILGCLTWLRISIDAACPETYSLIHRCPEEDFNKVISNIKEAVKIKKSKGYNCTIGVQFLLLNQNCNEVTKLVCILKKIGVDYLIIKPYSQHPFSINRLGSQIDYKKFLYLEEELKKYNSDSLQIIFRKWAIAKLDKERLYQKCLGLSFWAYLSSKGDLYACSAFLGNKRFCYGNIYEKDFVKIWKGEKRKEILKMMNDGWTIKNCRQICHLDEINHYLWDLKFPLPHQNFI